MHPGHRSHSPMTGRTCTLSSLLRRVRQQLGLLSETQRASCGQRGHAQERVASSYRTATRTILTRLVSHNECAHVSIVKKKKASFLGKYGTPKGIARSASYIWMVRRGTRTEIPASTSLGSQRSSCSFYADFDSPILFVKSHPFK